jgi:hypothetical protein
MEDESADPASTTSVEHEHEHEPEQVDAERERRELALLVNEIEERPADEAGYGHGV